MEQQIRFCTTSDGVRIAYATVGPVRRAEFRAYRNGMLPAATEEGTSGKRC